MNLTNTFIHFKYTSLDGPDADVISSCYMTMGFQLDLCSNLLIHKGLSNAMQIPNLDSQAFFFQSFTFIH